MLVYSGSADKAQQTESYQQHAVYGGEKGKMLKPAARSPWGQLHSAWGLRDTVAAGRAPEQGGMAPASPALAWFVISLGFLRNETCLFNTGLTK